MTKKTTPAREASKRGRAPTGYDPAKVAALSQWLEQKFIERQQQYRPKHRTDHYTIDDFAQDIGIKGATLGHWMRGIRVPGDASVRQLAMALGYEIYDILGLARPDQDWEIVETEWSRLSPGAKAEIARIVVEDIEHLHNADSRDAGAGSAGPAGKHTTDTGDEDDAAHGGAQGGMAVPKRRGKT